MKKCLFFVAQLCKVVGVDHLKNGFSKIKTEPVKNGVFFFKDGKYFDIDTNIAYKSDVYVDTKFFINTSSIIAWQDYLKQHRIDFDAKKLNKNYVKTLYKRIIDSKKKHWWCFFIVMLGLLLLYVLCHLLYMLYLLYLWHYIYIIRI